MEFKIGDKLYRGGSFIDYVIKAKRQILPLNSGVFLGKFILA